MQTRELLNLRNAHSRNRKFTSLDPLRVMFFAKTRKVHASVKHVVVFGIEWKILRWINVDVIIVFLFSAPFMLQLTLFPNEKKQQQN